MRTKTTKYQSNWSHVFTIIMAEAILGILFLSMIASMQLKIASAVRSNSGNKKTISFTENNGIKRHNLALTHNAVPVKEKS
ncbi:MAG: hypothetical protein JW871_00245 [Endomicrobiales bacterium]|nr:hypothetical protein [Endomicrobiales bacterium]